MYRRKDNPGQKGHINMNGWKCYNRAAIPVCAPHEKPDMIPVENGDIWKLTGRPILARWISDWDCGHETNWWYVIKDEPFDISLLKSKRRYEITKGNRFFTVKEIDPAEWCEEIYRVTIAAYQTYSAASKPHISHDSYTSKVRNWKYYKTYGAFSNDNGMLCGYACLKKIGSYIDFCMMKADPKKEKHGVNAAMVNAILMNNEAFLREGGYICDGARSILHETAFQDYLEKYFGFRKAYCNLHIVYAPRYKHIVSLVFRCKKLISKSRLPIVKKADALIKMEEIRRESGQKR